ncbi:MAG TPA: LysE family translocator [Xanthobacteraceae bacterium]|jgi:threonine/homoserine/homoserine lactone efflux protein|nr:LysE family translocator [Xanthobacteraceae bacterium]
MNWHLFTAFLLITTVLILVPGPIVTLVIATSASKGLRAGLVTVAGTSSGNAVLLAVIALGLGWILTHALSWFDMLRFAGAAYLIWLGIQAWRRAEQGASAPPKERVYFWRGFLVALSNPKTIAFFTAFLPQFVDPSLPAAPQLSVMCLASVALAVLGDCGWAILAGLGRVWLMQPARAKLLGRVSGLTLIGGGIWLSLSRRPV